MASHKETDSDNAALGASGGRGSQSIADDGDVVGDNGRTTPDPTPPKRPGTPYRTKKAGVFRRLSRSVRSVRDAFVGDRNEKNDPEILRMKARESRWKAMAEQEVNGPFTDPDLGINFFEDPALRRRRALSRCKTSPALLKTRDSPTKSLNTYAFTKSLFGEQKVYQPRPQPQRQESKPSRSQSLHQSTSRTPVWRPLPQPQEPRPNPNLISGQPTYTSRAPTPRPEEPQSYRTQSLSPPTLRARPPQRSNTMASSLGRSGSLSQRFPGDMSHRPLDQIKKETKVANRGPHLRKATLPRADPIDSLDNILGHSYHHEGPFDATLASRNTNKKYAPIEAVKTTNEEALKATPRELVQDSLTKHVPLQGTANIPPGMTDMNGRRMSYEEGTDLQRDRFASGGPSRRYEDIDYHPDDLKGKGESYTIERAFKHGKSASAGSGSGVYEMQPTGSSKSSPDKKEGDVMVRQRSRSSSFGEGPSGSGARATSSESPFGGSSSSPGKRIATGLKKRIGSIRRKAGRDS
ncbi:Protein kinase [Apiospora arundinis]